MLPLVPSRARKSVKSSATVARNRSWVNTSFLTVARGVWGIIHRVGVEAPTRLAWALDFRVKSAILNGSWVDNLVSGLVTAVRRAKRVGAATAYDAGCDRAVCTVVEALVARYRLSPTQRYRGQNAVIVVDESVTKLITGWHVTHLDKVSSFKIARD